MNIIKNFQIEITVPKKDGAYFVKNGKFLGFTVKCIGDTVVLYLCNADDKEYTTKDILDRITPAKNTDYTEIPNTFLLYLAFVRRQVQDMDMNSSGVQCYSANNGNGYKIATYFELGEETPKKPKVDGTVTGYFWNVTIGLERKDTTKTIVHQDTAFCIKPESAVREVLDRLFRRGDSELLDHFNIVSPIEIKLAANRSECEKYDYVIMP